MTERGVAGPAPEADPVGGLLGAIESGSPPPAGLFAADAVLDATVPNWRYTRHGEDAVRRTLSEWYREPGRFQSLSRTPLPTGELVEFTLSWEEDGVAHAAHQLHVLRLGDGRIIADMVFCGGRWPAPLLADMHEAEAPACGWAPPLSEPLVSVATPAPAG